MSFQGPRRDGTTSAGLGRAREKIAAEERYADGMNLLREQRRARGGGPLRQAWKRLRAALRTEDSA